VSATVSNTVWFQCSAGVAGDMLLASLVDAARGSGNSSEINNIEMAVLDAVGALHDMKDGSSAVGCDRRLRANPALRRAQHLDERRGEQPRACTVTTTTSTTITITTIIVPICTGRPAMCSP
jgi:hypothetical protein